jgi:SAM-dependent methyltransferase
MALSKENPTKQEFEEFYEKSNPWNADGGFNDLVRQNILQKVFGGKIFKRGLDVACGEGYVTSRLSFVKEKFGVDISDNAISRATELYKDVHFSSGDAFKHRVVNGEFDFVSCFEALYYPTSEEERKNALHNLLSFGADGATYVFSVVTIGENKHRKYFTKNEFTSMLKDVGYKIDGIYGFVLGGKTPSLPFRIFRKVTNLILPFQLSVSIFAKITMNASDSYIYQHLFVCSRS